MTPTKPLDVAVKALLRIARNAEGDEAPAAIAAKCLRDLERLGDAWIAHSSVPASVEPAPGAAPAES